MTGYRPRDLVRPPGLLSLCRGPLAAIFPFVYRDRVAAIALLVAAGVSDVLDGWVARRLGEQTATGAALDGIMDKVFAVTVLVTLVSGGRLSLLDAALLCARELIELPVLAVAAVLMTRPHGVARPSNAFGKLATVLQFAAITVVLFGRGPRLACVVATAAFGSVAALTYAVREFAAAPKPAE